MVACSAPSKRESLRVREVVKVRALRAECDFALHLDAQIRKQAVPLFPGPLHGGNTVSTQDEISTALLRNSNR